jgi:hypothetical protein
MQTLAVGGKQPSEVGTHGSSRRRTAILFARSRALIPAEVVMDFEPRSIDDSRERDVDGRELNQGSRGGLSNPRERERLEPRDVFTRDLELPRGRERERVWARDSDVTLRGSEVRTLATVGAFRVVPAGDLRDGQDRPLDPHRGDLRHLRDQGLVETIPAIGEERALVTQTDNERMRWMRDLLEKASSTTQVIVMTCHPEQYQLATEKDATNTVDLQAVITRSAVGRARSHQFPPTVEHSMAEAVRPVPPTPSPTEVPKGRPGRRTEPTGDSADLAERLRRSLEKKK